MSWFRLGSLEQPEIDSLCKTAWLVEFVFEAIIVMVCGVAWAIAGFPRFTEVAALGGAGLVCFGAYYVGIIWNLKKR